MAVLLPCRATAVVKPLRGRLAGPVDTGYRIIVRGRTKTEVKHKLRTKPTELAAGIRIPANYTVEQCLKDWLETLNTQAESTRTGYRIMVRQLVDLIGTIKLAELKVRTSTSHLASWLSASQPGALGWPR